MKKILSILLFLSVFPLLTEGRGLWAYLNYSTFNSPEGPYVETYLTIAGNSVKFVPIEDGKFQATVNIVMTFSKDGQIKAFKKYQLHSPAIGDTSKLNFNFLDQQRFQLENGTYSFEVKLSDNNKDVKAQPYTQDIVVNFPPDKPSISGIELVKSYKPTASPSILSKSGQDMVPYVFSFIPEQEQQLTFYGEIYNMDKVIPADQKFLISCFLEPVETGFKLNDFAIVRKELAKPVNVILYTINVASLASGNYNLVVEARNQKNEVVVSNRVFIQRSNPRVVASISQYSSLNTTNTFVDSITNIDTLREYIRSTRPISGGMEILFIDQNLKTADLKLLQQYFLGFWEQRNATNPSSAWLAYKLEVQKVQNSFGTKFRKGYDTDRGRVYLEYGPPNVRSTAYTEPNTYPYEIWHYYTLKNQRNKKFVFYTEDLVTNDFSLLHSDATGEVSYPQWQVFLRNKISPAVDIQNSDVESVWGDQSSDFWTLPY